MTKQTKKDKKRQNKKIICHMSGVACCVLRVTCHLSITPTATATDPPPANSPIMHSRLVAKTPPKKNANYKKLSKRQKKYLVKHERNLNNKLSKIDNIFSFLF